MLSVEKEGREGDHHTYKAKLFTVLSSFLGRKIQSPVSSGLWPFDQIV